MMGSQLHGIKAVPNELLLRIVEDMDTKTRERFMLMNTVCADVHFTEKHYLRSSA